LDVTLAIGIFLAVLILTIARIKSLLDRRTSCFKPPGPGCEVGFQAARAMRGTVEKRVLAAVGMGIGWLAGE
jgi:hypothetical protein